MATLLSPKSLLRYEDFFQRALTAHLPAPRLQKLRNTSVLVAGVGGGGNIAELLARKGIGRLLVADLDIFEPHNIRQRGCLVSTIGREKVQVMRERLLDINPFLDVVSVSEGITLENAELLVRQSDYVVDMVDLHAPREKVALYRAARKHGKYVLTAPSIINGASLWVFPPDGVTFEEFWGYEEGLSTAEMATRLIRRVIFRFPEEAPEELYLAAARGERTIPLDAVGVDQAAVLTVSAVENLILGRRDRVVMVPRGIQVDMSDPTRLAEIIDLSDILKNTHGVER